MKKNNIFLLSFLIFILALGTGFRLSGIRPIWNDELYTQINTVDTKSYADILFLRFEEGNSAPLFYLIQKGFSDFLGFRFPRTWQGEWTIADPRSQILMRTPANLFMSLSLALLFWYFAVRFTVWEAGYALAVALSSFMLWSYWAEARPYALWFFLTTVQSLALLAILESKGDAAASWRVLWAAHLSLAFTVVFSAAQILGAAFCLGIFLGRKALARVLVSLLPVGVSVYYYFFSPHFRFWLKETPLQLISASFPKDRLLVLLLFAVFLTFIYLVQKRRAEGGPVAALITLSAKYLLFSVLMLVAAWGTLLLFKMRGMAAQVGFQISNRYFIYLTPIGIMATALCSLSLVRWAARNKALLALTVLLFAGLLALRCYRTYSQAVGIY